MAHQHPSSVLRLCLSALATLGLATSAAAVQLEPLRLISPVNGGVFEAEGLIPEQAGSANLADLGADEDGCRHTLGISEYEYYVATCPYTYFTALTNEWEPRSGRFKENIPQEIQTWVGKEFNSERQTDRLQTFDIAVREARARGETPPTRDNYLIPQNLIPLDKRYRLALQTYTKRGARPVILGKIALTGAWGMRTRLNLMMTLQALDGGYEELREKTKSYAKEGEAFSLAKWLPVYREVFTGGGLTNEGYVVTGLTLFGMELRDGSREAAAKVLEKLDERLANDTKQRTEQLRGLIRERRRSLAAYQDLLSTAGSKLIQAVEEEEFPRARLPQHILAVAECLRRTAKNSDDGMSRALDWYLALAKMPETQPRLREEIRAQGKSPSADAPQMVQLGWIADRYIQRLKEAGVVHSNDIGGVDKRVLTAVVYDGLGSLEYVNPTWTPRIGGNQEDCGLMLQLIGQAVVDANLRSGVWVTSLGELWERDFLKDRNRVNRFYCPVTGEKFLYRPLTKSAGDTTNPRTVVVCTSRPVPTNLGPRYGAYLIGNQLAWSETPFVPGEIAR